MFQNIASYLDHRNHCCPANNHFISTNLGENGGITIFRQEQTRENYSYHSNQKNLLTSNAVIGKATFQTPDGIVILLTRCRSCPYFSIPL